MSDVNSGINAVNRNNKSLNNTIKIEFGALGDDLSPDELTKVLGISPTEHYLK